VGPIGKDFDRIRARLPTLNTVGRFKRSRREIFGFRCVFRINLDLLLQALELAAFAAEQMFEEAYAVFRHRTLLSLYAAVSEQGHT
jgi:hypothetical protein